MEAIGTLVGGIAHDFNNMLAGMTGNLYLAKQRVQGQPDVVQKLANVEALFMRAADMIQQLLMNLINNARDALEAVDDPCITIRLQSFYPDDVFLERHDYFKACLYAHLSVKDNGIGIPAEQMEHLFEPFFTTKEQGKGWR